jgi:hypothetical protein
MTSSPQEHVLHILAGSSTPSEESAVCEGREVQVPSPTIPFLGYIISAGSVQMDPGKVRAVVDWSQPMSRVQLQRFLGFTNLYRSFIQGYSTLVSPMSTLTLTKVPFMWSSAADQAFQDLKHRFTTATFLVHPDPSCQFVMDVDASDFGVGAALGCSLRSMVERSTLELKLHPCAFFSHRLNAMVKMALEE